VAEWRAGQRIGERIRFVSLHLRRRLPAPGGAGPAARPRVVVSLTSTPARIAWLRPTLASLLDQSLRPDAIALNLPLHCERDGRAYAIPAALRSFPELRIERCERDLGPATKLIPTLARESDPETCVVAVDDDQIYPRGMLENLVRWSLALPDAALCHRGFRLPRALEHARRDTRLAERLAAPEPIEVIQGSAGYLVKPRFFGPALLDYCGAPASARSRDDVWISGQLARAGIARFVVPLAAARSRLARNRVHRRGALSRGPNRDERGASELYRHFLRDWKLRD